MEPWCAQISQHSSTTHHRVAFPSSPAFTSLGFFYSLIMSFRCQLRSGLYSDKAVQTECPTAAIHRGTDSSGTVSPSGIADLAINELLSRSGGAYRHSRPSGMPTPSLSGGPVNGKTWLDYNHPWNTRGVQRRVVSHPESVTCAPQTLYTDSGRPRVVSLPESTSLKGCLSIQKHHQDLEQHNREYPFDLPHTPSPPSSPDSIVIVGNETRLPSSFFQSHLDENGNSFTSRRNYRAKTRILAWTAWANSPPRPIPALHGPSSLPYARCPSSVESPILLPSYRTNTLICRGAEGTVVEGDDLATKVWGLGSDEPNRLRLKSPQPPRSSASSPPLPLVDNLDYLRVTSSALARHRDAVIDLAKPTTFSPGAFNSVGGRLVSFDETYPSAAGYPGRPNLCVYTRSYQDMRLEKMTTVSTKDCPEPTSAALTRELVARSQGLPQTAKKSNLNSAAQSFIPAYSRDIDFERACIQQDAEFGDFDYTHRSRDSRRQASNSELTPASTASPLWSPVFRSVPTIMSGDHNPRIYSPQTDLDSCSNKLITQQLNGEDIPIVQQRLRAEQVVKSATETFYARSYVVNNAVCMKDANAANGIHPPTLEPCNSTEANQVEFCERLCHLSHQQSRSVPMARLMQRRLSSVVEENILGSCELSRGHTKTASKALRRAVLVLGQSKVSDVRETEISDGGESSSSNER